LFIFIFVFLKALAMKNKLWIPLIAILLLTALDGYGQRWRLQRYEADLYLSAVAFHGDIGLANENFLNNFNGVRPSIGFYPKFRVFRDVKVGLDLSYLMYGGKDKEGSSHNRLYSFTSHGFQHVARVEYYFFGLGRSQVTGAIYNRRGMLNEYNQLFIYAFAGAGGVVSKSKVKDLNNGGEEPLNNPGYSNKVHYSAVFPLGIGFRFVVDPRWSIGGEFGYQFTTTDWLDGYSSQWSEYNDSYYLASVKAIYHIRNERNGRPIFRKLYR
jgi:hypothetical protein